MQDTWTKVDEYFDNALLTPDNTLESALKVSDGAGLPEHAVAPNQGKLLMLMAQMQGATKILEIGTLGGYSTIWLAKALPEGGSIITLEYESHHADVAEKNIENAGYGGKVDIRVGAAVETLPVLADEGHVFDLIFIDANKDDNPTYLEWSLKMSRIGTVIIVDNVVRGGGVLDPNSDDIRIQGTRQVVEMMKSEPRIDATMLQTVGSKGWDGFILSRVLSE